jgi:hypothetical protein
VEVRYEYLVAAMVSEPLFERGHLGSRGLHTDLFLPRYFGPRRLQLWKATCRPTGDMASPHKNARRSTSAAKKLTSWEHRLTRKPSAGGGNNHNGTDANAKHDRAEGNTESDETETRTQPTEDDARGHEVIHGKSETTRYSGTAAFSSAMTRRIEQRHTKNEYARHDNTATKKWHAIKVK